MKVNSETIIQNFKPIRVSIDIESGQEMDDVVTILETASRRVSLPRLQEVINKLLPAFTRL